MIGRILCRLGWHSWDRLVVREWVPDHRGIHALNFTRAGFICRRCRKRVSA